MTVLHPVCKYQYEVSLESEDGKLSFPGSFTKSSGFSVKLSGNYTCFDPIEIRTDYDPAYFRDLIKYCIRASASGLTEESFREKVFTLSFHFPPGTPLGNEGYCAYDCRLTGFRFLEVDRRLDENDPSAHTSELSLTFQPRYIGFL